MTNIRFCDPVLLAATEFLHHSKLKSRTHPDIIHLERMIYDYICRQPMQFIFQFANTEIEAMARFTQSTFASITLTSENKKDFEKWSSSSSLTALECLNKLMADGFKVSASWVTDQNAFCCSIIGTDVTKHHKDMVMTSWSDDLEEVILIGTYKHYVLCNGDEWPTRDAGQRWG